MSVFLQRWAFGRCWIAVAQLLTNESTHRWVHSWFLGPGGKRQVTGLWPGRLCFCPWLLLLSASWLLWVVELFLHDAPLPCCFCLEPANQVPSPVNHEPKTHLSSLKLPVPDTRFQGQKVTTTSFLFVLYLSTRLNILVIVYLACVFLMRKIFTYILAHHVARSPLIQSLNIFFSVRLSCCLFEPYQSKERNKRWQMFLFSI